MRGRTFRQSYSPPALDSERAIASATMFLTNARSIDHVTIESLARQCQLSSRRAEYMLTIEQQRRRRRTNQPAEKTL